MRGFPFESLAELPAGTYSVQALPSVYSRFDRADGHTISMHLNSGAGQNQWKAPGNAVSTVSRLDFDPSGDGSVSPELTDIIEPQHPVPPGGSLQQGNPPDSDRLSSSRSAAGCCRNSGAET